MPHSTTQDPDTGSTTDVVADAATVVAAFIALVGIVVCVIATLTTFVLVVAGELVVEAPIVAALGALAAVFFGAASVAQAAAGAVARPDLTARRGHRGPEDTAGPFCASR